MNPRQPTEKEKQELVTYWAARMSPDATKDEVQQQEEFVESAAIAVFDRYITDGQGYAGKLMTVVWSGSPSFYSVYVWREDGICEVEREC